MYLKRLELCGFKSFADKTSFNFEPGITAIVGPNGCGKSNTVDAIRWCLGEQSARSMRSHQMLDVIFNGSQSRHTTGMSEVSLTFDNSKNVLPIDYSEVTVTRRLFRSGESEYFLNKAQCRLKDIRDLFLDTGIGSEGYAIIEQGKVEFILTARPEERREMFEEAAGVSKYKVRREEAIRRLEKVEIDMNRITDMISLLKDQISSLDIAAKKARQYQRIKDELKRMETTALVHSVLNSAKMIDEIKLKLNPLLKEYEIVNTSQDSLEAELSKIRVLQMEKDEQYVKRQNEFAQIKSDINLSDERVQQSSQREADYVQQRQSLETQIEEDKRNSVELEKELSELTGVVASLEVQVKKLEEQFKEKENELSNVKRLIEVARDKEKTASEELISLASTRAGLHNEQNRLKSLSVHSEFQVESLNKEITRTSEHKSSLSANIENIKNELNELKNRSEDVSKKKARLDEEISAVNSSVNQARVSEITLKEKIASSQAKLATLQEWESKDPARMAINSVLSFGLPGVKGPLSGMLNVKKGSEKTVADTLGDRLNYIVCDTAATAVEAIERLRNANSGHCTFIVAENLPEKTNSGHFALPADAVPLLSLMQYKKENENILKFVCGDLLVSGGTVYGNALISGGSEQSEDGHALIEKEKSELKNSIEFYIQDMQKNENELGELSRSLESKEDAKRETDTEHSRAVLEAEWLRKNLAKLEEELQYAEKGISIDEGDIQSHRNEQENCAKKIAEIDGQLKDIEKREADLRTALEAVKKERSALEEKENEINPVFTESKVRWAASSNELSGRQREIDKTRETIDGLRSRVENAVAEHSSLANKINDQQKVREAESVRVRELGEKLKLKETEVQEMLSERQELMQSLENRNSELHEIRKKCDELKQVIHSLEIDHKSFELQKQNVENRIREDFGVEFNDIRQEHEKETYSDEEIARLKKRIDSMGPVNLAAPEEYASLEERYKFLQAQQEDLQKAKDDLHQVINRINHTTRENFKKTFDLVRENFRNIYHQLFEGGEADLALTDETNLLETGVDIFAQPPGKKLQNIALLSGGEKALTAIALLFAFFMVRSSPFCILDEVDAPLDDANIGRYINMVKAFVKTSQFLVITHNKRTMEMADVLYGVTMEELGVSKIISVKLNNELLTASA
ncbi:MAG: chromosome segregation protein SMC [Endomicrobiales bacterium]|nr:chromosome segregation protein SMC [Endomicrobiales bacterium]